MQHPRWIAALLSVSALGSWSMNTAWAHKNNTYATVEFSTNPVVEGTLVTITGTVTYDGAQASGSATGHTPYPSSGDPITSGAIQIQQQQDASGSPVACETAGATFVTIASAPPVDGQFSTTFDTTGLGGQTIGFRTHHPATNGSHGDAQAASSCQDLVVIVRAQDPLPDGTASFTQGFYGASPIGEALVPYLIDAATCEDIREILGAIAVLPDSIDDCTAVDDRAALALFLTGTVGPGKDEGFLPSGFGPGQNLAAQAITLLLNLNLAAVLEDPARPLLESYFLNIDVVEDLFGEPPASSVPSTFVDPIFNNPALGSCTDATSVDGVCDAGTVLLTSLGEKVKDLDEASTTIADIVTAANSLLISGDTTVVVNGVILTRDEMTKILGLINESYDESVSTAFITAFDAD